MRGACAASMASGCGASSGKSCNLAGSRAGSARPILRLPRLSRRALLRREAAVPGLAWREPSRGPESAPLARAGERQTRVFCGDGWTRHTPAAHRRDLPRAAAILRRCAVLRRRRGAREFSAVERHLAAVRQARSGRVRQGDRTPEGLRPQQRQAGHCARAASLGRRLHRAFAQSRAAGVPVPGGPAAASCARRDLRGSPVERARDDPVPGLRRETPSGHLEDPGRREPHGQLPSRSGGEPHRRRGSGTGVSNHAVLGFGLGIRVVERHPDTGAALAGVALPQWDVLREVVLRGTRALPGLRWQHWDIAFARNGPTALEVNLYAGGGTDISQVSSGTGLLDEQLEGLIRESRP